MSIIRGPCGHNIFDSKAEQFVAWLRENREGEPWRAEGLWELYADWFSQVAPGQHILPLTRGGLFRALAHTAIGRYRAPTGRRPYLYRFVEASSSDRLKERSPTPEAISQSSPSERSMQKLSSHSGSGADQIGGRTLFERLYELGALDELRHASNVEICALLTLLSPGSQMLSGRDPPAVPTSKASKLAGRLLALLGMQ